MERELKSNRAAGPLRGALGLSVGATMLFVAAVVYVAFLILLWVRPIVQAALHGIGGFFLLGGLAAFVVVAPGNLKVPWILCSASFAAFVLSWFFDWLLLRFAPEPISFFE